MSAARTTPMLEPVNVLDYEERAREVLSKSVFDYFASGSGAEVTVRANAQAFEELSLRPRVLVPVGDRDLSTTVLGRKLPTPIIVAPMAFQKLAHPDGEIGAVRAAGAAGATFTASTMANTVIEEIAAVATGPLWYQLYVFKDRGITRELVQRAEEAGCQAMQVTVDVPVMGRREADMRNAFCLPPEFTVKNLEAAGHGALPIGDGESGPARYTRCLFDADLSWKDIDWFCSLTRMPVLVKGVLRGDDAVRAIDNGAAGVVVSNHGGRQLDTSPATIRVLPEVVEVVAGRGAVLIDGGIRRGTDLLKALALGANAVQVGRPVLWGLAVGGEAGARRVLELLRDEFDNAMALCGCPSVGQITRDLVV
jgi:4-hydroxymandelate oxidase